jgi:hypothetical protein
MENFFSLGMETKGEGTASRVYSALNLAGI